MDRRMSLLMVVALVGCAHSAPMKKSEEAAAAPSSTPATTAPRETIATAEKTCSADADCGDKQLCIRQRCVDISAGLAECTDVRVHFDFNSFEIASADRGFLERSARCLKADQSLHVAIEGNTDERGTEEYNLALGDQRATAVAKYLESMGVSVAQLRTVSYGKEQPLCTDHDETCWAKNRRAQIKANAAKPGKK